MVFKKKIIGICLLWSLLFLVCSGVILFSQETQNSVLRELEHSKQVVQSFNKLLIVMINMETGIRGYLLSADDAYLEPFNQNEAKFDQEIRAAEALTVTSPDQTERLKTIMTLKTSWITGPAVEEMMARKKLSRNMISAQDFTNVFTASRGKEFTDGIRRQVEAALSHESDRMTNLAEEQSQASRRVKLSIFVGVPFSVIVGLLLMIFAVSRVNFTIQQLVESLFKTASSMNNSGETMTTCGADLNQTNASLSSSSQMTASAVTQISSMASANTDTANSALKTVASCVTTSAEGQEAMGAVRSSMIEIDECARKMVKAFTENNQKLATITGMMAKIQSKTKIINDIVFQTKLLSFNASVEAARAGEHGKGFSVVAEEIGTLANHSGNAAKDIAALLNDSTAEVQRIIADTASSMNQIAKDIQTKIAGGIEKSQLSDEKLNMIREQVSSVQSVIDGIVGASREQSTGVNSVREAVMDIEKSTRSQTSLFQKYAETADTLKELSSDLDGQVSELKLLFGVFNQAAQTDKEAA